MTCLKTDLIKDWTKANEKDWKKAEEKDWTKAEEKDWTKTEEKDWKKAEEKDWKKAEPIPEQAEGSAGISGHDHHGAPQVWGTGMADVRLGL